MRDDLFTAPGTPVYRTATTPRNSSVVQQPAVVAHPHSAEEVAQAVRWATDRNLGVSVQATGHGAGAPIGPNRVLIDTSALDTVSIDPNGRTARVGAGTRWGALNAQAQQHGLLGMAGSSPTVSVAGYTFGGGVGWMTRPYGMASSALMAVDYVDGDGNQRRASDDATDPVDREALWAFRGGGGVGVATSLTMDLIAPQNFWAGYQLWDISALRPVAEAWARAMDDIGDALATHISVVHTPPDWPFPASLRGVPIVHVAFASPVDPDAAYPLLRALYSAPRPALDSAWAPADARRLAEIHLDPPNAVPVLGIGRWLGSTTPKLAVEVLESAAAPDSPVTMIELRNVDNDASVRPGALTAVPAPYVLHAVGRATDPGSRAAVEQGLARVREAVQAADTGQAAASFAQGRAEVADALPSAAMRRLVRLRAEVDPHSRITPSRIAAAVKDIDPPVALDNPLA